MNFQSQTGRLSGTVLRRVHDGDGVDIVMLMDQLGKNECRIRSFQLSVLTGRLPGTV